MENIKKDQIIYRKATRDDCSQMTDLINSFAREGLMLYKSKAKILAMLPHYFVAAYEKRIISTVGFKIWADYQVELISLATCVEFQRKGIGNTILKICIDEACALGFRNFFTLTVQPALFARIGFNLTDHKNLHCKIYTDCADCARNAGGPGDPRCNEVALTLSI
jgi:amino-acid N-acetyltransferase